MRSYTNTCLLLTCVFTLVGCNLVSPNIPKNVVEAVEPESNESELIKTLLKESELSSSLDIQTVLSGKLRYADKAKTFSEIMSAALLNDPLIIAQAQTVRSKRAEISISEAGKDFEVSGVLYGGIEDVTDEVSGVAFVIDAKRLIFDGGRLDAIIAAKKYEEVAARHDLRFKLNQRALELGKTWIDLERYQRLSDLIDGRLAVLEPILENLEQIAASGVSDISKVTAAQRTVTGIRSTQAGISEKLEQTRISYLNAFGSLPKSVNYNSNRISKNVPPDVSDVELLQAPNILAKFALYNVAEASLAATKAKRNLSVGFEAKYSRPFGGSTRSADESIGLVLRKSFYDGKKLEFEENEAEASVERAISELQLARRQNENIVKIEYQNIKSLEKAKTLAAANIKINNDEIKMLEQQLNIGGSSLDSVLTAKARLYDATARQINLQAEQKISEISILATLGVLTSAIGL